MPKNSGHPGEPRNKGIALASGEYIYCLDSDDIITETALEEMYSLGKKFDADVVYCEKYFKSEGVGKEFKDNIRVTEDRIQKPPFVTEPTLETTDQAERIEKMLNGNYWMSPALKIVKRNLLLENDIIFPNLVGSEDDIWSMEVLFCSKCFLRIPNICFIRRIHEDGISFGNYTTSEHIERWMDATIRNSKEIDDFLKKIPFFRENPNYRYEIISRSLKNGFSNISKRCEKETPFNIYSIFQEKFGNFLGQYDVLVSALCSNTIIQQRSLLYQKKKALQEAEQRIAELEKEISHSENNTEDSIVYTPRPPCAISIVIPMYNAEEYISECLDSLLIQTFQDFEVIVVDDCSTDNSYAIAKSYSSKFNYRITLAQTKVNSGGGGYIPRNIGLKLAQGEYIFFVDSDDFILNTALETLYNAAKENDADVVYYSSYYRLKQPNDIYLHRDGEGKKLIKAGLEDKPVLTVDDTNKLLSQLFMEENEGNFRAPWSKFIRRDFLIDNEILFPKMFNGGDFIWVIDVYCHVKRFLRIPTPLYFYRRYNTKSVTQMKREPPAQIQHWFSGFAIWAKALSELANKNAVLSNNRAYCFAALKSHFEWSLFCMREARVKLSEREIYELLRKEFAEEKGSLDLMLPFLFSVIKGGKKSDEAIVTIVDKFKPFVTARVDVKLIPKVGKGKFEILSISDSTATIEKPGWLQKNGVGYIIQSCFGKLKIVVKSTVDGKLSLVLRGADVKDTTDNPKRIPYWIDYTKLAVNDKIIIDKLKPVWHDKHYRYSLEVNADEEITIQMEWLPHKSDM